ncbi:cation:proton antiporter [Acanthopleuribacter pedis]|uniref:Cation:proton antiporter n=1 Tax=Acanthopleuribacter pedis TaxID=442870 RepID=A0A8J7U7M8_9BACT|nr:cation:proton antiporter [Acanthopleuribacter pedis]MBO1321576.1 cation:proton antiporter [Acanthopleuribacter pedis]
MASFVHDLGIVLGVATGTSIICRKINQPSILGFLAAGLIVGPYIPIPLFADTARVHTLSEFGVVLVMFYIGLEFQLSKLFKVLPVAGFAALIEIGTMLFLGFTIGLALGWSNIEALFLGACICISSTMLVSKIFEDGPVGADVRTFVLGILVLQDVAAIALIAAMTAVAESGSVSVQSLALTLGKLLFTLTMMIALGLPIVPRLVRHVMSFKNNEVIIISAIGLCFSFSLLAESLGYSVALGAFVAGVLVSESGRGHDIVHAIQPVKDIFAAVFFVSIGMTVEPQLALENIGPSMLVFVCVIVFQLLSISIAGVLSGNGLQKSMTSGLSLGQIGEFGFIIAAIGISAEVVRPGLQPIMVTVAVLTAFTTPLALKWAPRMVAFVDHNLPNRFKNSIVVYEGWISGLRTSSGGGGGKSPRRKAVNAITFDALVWVVVTALFMYGFTSISTFLSEKLAITPAQGKMVSFAVFFVASIPLLIGIVRNTHKLVEGILQGIEERRARANAHITPIGASLLRASIHVLVMMGIGIPAVVILLPFVGSAAIIALVAAGIIMMMGLLWRSAGRFDAEIRSEAERLIAFLDRQRTEGVSEQAPQAFFPDLDKMDGIFILEGLPVIGKTLSELNLRARSGALVVAIHREGTDVVLPTGSEIVRAEDLLFVTGTEEAVAKAREIITNPEAEES